MCRIKDRRKKKQPMNYFIAFVVMVFVAIIVILLCKYGFRETNSSIVLDENGKILK